jgi:ABC-type polysaccharide/polyol phosphate transport system ATPase subunit
MSPDSRHDARRYRQQNAGLFRLHGVGEYLDLPVRTYSSGIMTRLTFAVTTCLLRPRIVLMDE